MESQSIVERSATLQWRPPFLHEIEDLTQEIGIVDATRQLLARDNITVDVYGEHSRLAEHDGGLLFVGDHRKQWEFVALMDVLSRMGRTEMYNVAKFYVKTQVAKLIGAEAAANILPVYPRILASDLAHNFDSESISRMMYRRSLLPADESRVVNTAALDFATRSLESDGVVNIFPCGTVADWRKSPWRSGVGRIIQQLSETGKEQTLVSLYRLGDIVSWRRVVAAIALRGRGLAGRPQTLPLELAPVKTAAEIVGSLAVKYRDDPDSITDALRRNLLASLEPRFAIQACGGVKPVTADE